MNDEEYNAREEAKEIVGTCIKCGLCKELCPVFKILREEESSPRGHAILISENIFDESFFQCTLCGACEEKCPMKIKLCEAIKKARLAINLSGKENPINKEIVKKIINRENPFLKE